MKLEKIAHIEMPAARPAWMTTHLANPIVRSLDSTTIRVYCNTRNEKNQSKVIYLDLNLKDNFQVVNFHDEPLLELGNAGAFDDCGQSLGCYISKDDYDYLFYLGWNLALNIPFRNSIGVARSQKGKDRFERFSDGPIMDRDMVDPYCLSYPYILYNGDMYKMWYGSHTVSGATVSDIRHCIKYAESRDLINWERKNVICLSANESDTAFTRPFVLYEDGHFKMWYSYLRGMYRIGYAESADGISWVRMDDKVGISTSNTGWDSEMIEYPYVFDHFGQRYLAYCGNQFGKAGFGIAKFI